jgi:large subunit ribosomal protein L30
MSDSGQTSRSDSGSDSGQIRITQVRSLIGRPPDQRRTVQALGLKRIRHSVVQPDRPEIRGMISKVAHLVSIEEIES